VNEAARVESGRGESTTAVFFDLDRTLLVGASGPVLSAAMRRAGVVDRTILGEGALFELFNRVGETLPSMALARLAVAAAKGRRREDVARAARSAARELADMVPRFARQVIEEHRREGRTLVMATTTPYDLVAPLAELLGFDDVVATRYRVGPDGTYDGSLDGPFVWNSGKLAAVRTWSRDRGIDLTDCYAYSDSVFDVPLLSAVGHPTAVNPDPRLAVVAAARRWPVLHFDVPPGVAKVPVVNMELQSLLLQLARPTFIPFARFDIDGTHNIPDDSAAIICGNHRSYFDVFAMAVTVAKTGRPVRFLGKKEVFDAPLVGQLATALGGIRVERGTGSDQPLDAAMDALRAGELVAIMPEGTIPRGPAFFEPDLKGRWGAVRLARSASVPLVPVGLWGTEKVWPRAARLPNLLNVVNPPRIRVRVGEPLYVSGDDHEANTQRLMSAIRSQLPIDAQVRRTPTAEELRLSYPPGYKGDPATEGHRRPGSD
jgi:putative phosphoserine phosphatase/1-acylglycerol-3-phosphate O-acyltransferase